MPLETAAELALTDEQMRHRASSPAREYAAEIVDHLEKNRRTMMWKINPSIARRFARYLHSSLDDLRKDGMSLVGDLIETEGFVSDYVKFCSFIIENRRQENYDDCFDECRMLNTVIVDSLFVFHFETLYLNHPFLASWNAPNQETSLAELLAMVLRR